VNWPSTWWQQVSPTVTNGLQITIIGMALVFLTLGLIIVVLVLLTRLPGLSRAPSREQDVTTDTPSDRPVVDRARGSGPSDSEQTHDLELAQVAAIAVALLHSHRTRPPRSGSRMGRWKQYGRAQQLGL
jgi:Na+-transporting methylmalonyl-CoA/oxaloacetate decarboxylase gamma subunit